MFHVKQFVKNPINTRVHELLFYFFLFLIPVQTRVLYNPDRSYIGWYFNYHLAFFLYLSDIILLACLVSWMFDKPLGSIVQKRLFWLMLAFFAAILLSLFHVKRLDLGWYQALKWVELLLLVLYISESYTERTRYFFSAWIIFVSSVIQAILALVQFHVQHGLKLGFLGEYIAPLGTPGLATIGTSADKVIRAYGTFPHPNILGAFLVFGLILGLFLVSRPPVPNGNVRAGGTKTVKIAVLLGLFVINLGIFVSFSRIAWLAAAISILCFLGYYLMKQRKRLAVAILIPAIVSCATVMIYAPKTLKTRVSDSNSTSISDRSYFNKLGLDLVKRFPVFGVGAGNYVEALQDLNRLDDWQYQPAHNIFVFLAAETGLLGLALFLMLLFEIFSRLKNVPPASPGGGRETLIFTFAVLGIIFLLMGQFDHYFVTIQQGRMMFFTVLGMIAALPNIYAQKSDQKIYT